MLDLTIISGALDQIINALHSTLQEYLGHHEVVLHSVGIVTSFPTCKAQVIHRYLPCSFNQLISHDHQGRPNCTDTLCCVCLCSPGTASVFLETHLTPVMPERHHCRNGAHCILHGHTYRSIKRLVVLLEENELAAFHLLYTESSVCTLSVRIFHSGPLEVRYCCGCCGPCCTRGARWRRRG